MTYYHMCQIPLEKGSIIKPGNYGRMLEYDKGRNSIIYNRETILEGIRKKLCPEKPSRLHSCFVCDDIKSTLMFFQHDFGTCLCYEVEIVDASAKMYRTSAKYISDLQQVYTREWADSRAVEYWEWDESKNDVFPMEVLTSSPIKILTDGINLQQFLLTHLVNS